MEAAKFPSKKERTPKGLSYVTTWISRKATDPKGEFRRLNPEEKIVTSNVVQNVVSFENFLIVLGILYEKFAQILIKIQENCS